MKRALLASGGQGTRLFPLSLGRNKHILPVAGEPMINYGIRDLVASGVKEVILATNPDDYEIVRVARSAVPTSVKISVVEASAERGLPDLILAARPFLGDQPFIFYLADNLFQNGIGRCVEAFLKVPGCDCCVMLAATERPENFGAVELDLNLPIRFEETPKSPKGMETVTGVYAYSNRVFDAVEQLTAETSGYLTMSELHQYLLSNGYAISWVRSHGWWRDAGSLADFREANELILKAQAGELRGAIDAYSRIEGSPIVRPTASVKDSLIIGPSFISEGCRIEKSTIGPYAVIGRASVIVDSTVVHSVLLPGCSVTGGLKVLNSLAGENCVLAGPGDVAESLTVVLGDRCTFHMSSGLGLPG